MNLYKKIEDESIIKIKLLFGLIYLKKDKEDFSSALRILGLLLLRTKHNNGIKIFYLLGIPVFFISSKYDLYNTLIKITNNGYKNIYINMNCSGETYLTLSYLKFYNKIDENNSVFIAAKKYHIDLCNMFYPNIKCIYAKNLFTLRKFDNKYKDTYKNKNFYEILPFKHFVNLENSIQKGKDIHYCEEICKSLGLKYSSEAAYPAIDEKIKENTLKKANTINLNINKFVMLCPESQSNETGNKEIWIKIIDELTKLGYDIFSNTMCLKPEYGIAKTCYLTLEEAYYLAGLSKGIIGLRSGFIEPLTTHNNIPIICFYTPFKERGVLKSISSEKVMKSYTLKKLPNVNPEKIYEIDITNTNAQTILNVIQEVF